jgi:hypothetical protein
MQESLFTDNGILAIETQLRVALKNTKDIHESIFEYIGNRLYKIDAKMEKEMELQEIEARIDILLNQLFLMGEDVKKILIKWDEERNKKEQFIRETYFYSGLSEGIALCEIFGKELSLI